MKTTRTSVPWSSSTSPTPVTRSSSRPTGRTGLDRALGQAFDLVILDIMLPGIDGLEICRRLRTEKPGLPILMLTARTTELDRVLGLEMGADDYLTKPFSVRELVARVKAIFRRMEVFDAQPATARLGLGPVEIDTDSRRVLIEGEPVELTAREFDLLTFFARHPGRVFTRGQLLDKVWGYTHEGYEHTVNTHINRLRGKLEADPSHPRFILTVWGVGYRFPTIEELDNMMKSLHARLVAVLLGLLLVLGAILITISFYSTKRYEEEVVQRLNRALASSLVAEDVLLVKGEVNEKALEHVFHTLMVINPSIEVYLLDLEGNVVQHSSPRAGCCRDTHRYRTDQGLPRRWRRAAHPRRRSARRATDTRSSRRRSSWSRTATRAISMSSWPARPTTRWSSGSRGSHILRLSVLVTFVALVLAGVAGVVLFSHLTRRLRIARRGHGRLQNAAISRPRSGTETRRGSGDEIDTLTDTFESMSDRIIQQVRTLKQTDELRRELVANVSHDLRTPLASLTGYIETLQLKEGRLTDEERDQYLAVARRQSERLATLVEELFELARLESRDMEPELEPFPLPELVQDVVQGFRLEAEQKGVTLDLERPDEVPLVSADIGLIQRALQNLIGNALKHTEEGGRVSVFIEPLVNKVAVRIEDTGCGIPDEELEQIFDRFYQARNHGEKQSTAGRARARHRQADPRAPRLRRRSRQHRRRGHGLHLLVGNGLVLIRPPAADRIGGIRIQAPGPVRASSSGPDTRIRVGPPARRWFLCARDLDSTWSSAPLTGEARPTPTPYSRTIVIKL